MERCLVLPLHHNNCWWRSGDKEIWFVYFYWFSVNYDLVISELCNGKAPWMPHVRKWSGMVRGERHSLKVRENNNLCAFERSHKMSSKLDLIPIIFSWHRSSWWKLLSIIFQSCNLKLVWEWSCTFSFSFFSLFSNIYLMLKMWEVFSAFHTLGFFSGLVEYYMLHQIVQQAVLGCVRKSILLHITSRDYPSINSFTLYVTCW